MILEREGAFQCPPFSIPPSKTEGYRLCVRLVLVYWISKTVELLLPVFVFSTIQNHRLERALSAAAKDNENMRKLKLRDYEETWTNLSYTSTQHRSQSDTKQQK